MTFLGWDEALEACATQQADLSRANDLLTTAYEQLAAARDSLVEEDGFWDGSTYGSGAAIGGLILACLGPVRGTLCVGGILVGTVGFAGSEIDRESDINDAQAAVEQAQLLVDLAQIEFEGAMASFMGCMAHHVTKSSG